MPQIVCPENGCEEQIDKRGVVSHLHHKHGYSFEKARDLAGINPSKTVTSAIAPLDDDKELKELRKQIEKARLENELERVRSGSTAFEQLQDVVHDLQDGIAQLREENDELREDLQTKADEEIHWDVQSIESELGYLDKQLQSLTKSQIYNVFSSPKGAPPKGLWCDLCGAHTVPLWTNDFSPLVCERCGTKIDWANRSFLSPPKKEERPGGRWFRIE